MSRRRAASGDLEFEGEMLVPTVNILAYRQVYHLEGWVRRICLAAWMAKYGSEWPNHLDTKVRQTLESRASRNRQRVYLGSENEDDLLWQATHGELVRLLESGEVSELLLELTGTPPRVLAQKLDEIREIRNILAHNRALSSRTQTILRGLVASLEEAVETFRKQIVYGGSQLASNDDPLAQRVESAITTDYSTLQPFVFGSDLFIEFVSLPISKRESQWPDAARLLQIYREHLPSILAILLNKEVDEYRIIVPRAVPEEAQFALCDRFALNHPVWTKVPYRQQDARYICSPKIWFYENNSYFEMEPLF